METSWIIDTPDSHKIYGVKNTGAAEAKSAIFIVHGLTGNMYEYAIKRAADHFSTRHDVYRFSLYGGEDGARQLINCTIQTHADDLNTVLAACGSAYEKIFLIGHSFGGPSIMLAQPARITAASLWDPSFDLKTMQAAFAAQYVEAEEFCIVN